jgi:hypothetical protein
LKEIPITEQDKMMVFAGGFTRLRPDIANDRLLVEHWAATHPQIREPPKKVTEKKRTNIFALSQ